MNRREFARYVARAGVALTFLAASRREARDGRSGGEAFYDGYLSIYFDGGPSQTDTWDVKPGSSSSYPNFPTIDLGVTDEYGESFRIAGLFRRLAGLCMNDPAIKLGVIRSLYHAGDDHVSAQDRMRGCLHDGFSEAMARVEVSHCAVDSRLTVAQKLLVAGAPFVAIDMPGNDSHSHNLGSVACPGVVPTIWGNYINEGLSQLAESIRASGRRVLVTMYGDFGRTPRSVSNGDRDGRDHWNDGFSIALLSINQPRFKMTALGHTGPDGVLTSTTGMRDPVEPRDVGTFVSRSLGFQVGRVDGKFDVPLTSRPAPPVDRINKADLLNTTFGLV